MILDNLTVVIVASGNGERMKSVTGGLYPKLFATIGKQTLFDKIVENCKGVRKIVVIGNRNLTELVEIHAKKHYPSHNISTFIHNDPDGSYSAIYDWANHAPFVCNILVHWSDITTNIEDLFADVKNTNERIVFTKSGKYRYGVENNVIKLMENGNIPGLYYVPYSQQITNTGFQYGADFIDFFMANRSTFVEIPGELIDNGDLEKHKYVMDQAEIESRSFNSLQITDEYVIKCALDEHGRKIQKFEYNFYKRHKIFQGTILPKVIKYEDSIGRLIIERLKGFITLHEFIKQNKNYELVCNVIKRAKYTLDVLHNTKTYYKFEDNIDIENEFYQSMIGRTSEVSHLLSEKLSVNNRKPKFSFESLCKIWNAWLKACEFEFSECHGDPNSSNIMVNPQTLEIKLIDPRGYFGKNTKTSSVLYDEAKFVYGLHAYSDLNLLKVPLIENPYDDNTRNFNMREIQSFDLNILLDQLYPNDNIYQSQIKMFVGLIFIKLTGYIKNDPTKSNIAYIYGRLLMEDGMNELGLISY